MRRVEHLITAAIFAAAALIALGGAVWAVNVIESTGGAEIRERFVEAGHDWIEVDTDGLQVILTGTAPTEATRFRALSIAGGVVDPARVIDRMDVADRQGLEPPRFSMEILRNDDGVSLIGLIPMAFGREAILTRIGALDSAPDVADMLDSTDHPVPAGWAEAVAFGLDAMAALPRSKISITADEVRVTAISNSRDQKRRLENELRRKRPEGIAVMLDISAPRPVIAPFTLRFVIDDVRGARFDACAADTQAAQGRILAAGISAGAPRDSSCTIGLGVPTPDWADATIAGIAALERLGAGSITFADADVSLIVPHTVAQEPFDAAVGRLDSALPDVFSLESLRLESPENESETQAAAPEFIASLSDEGEVLLRGVLADERMREAVQGYARSRFGMASVQTATRLAPELPEGWTLRVLSALEALAELNAGVTEVRPESIALRGISGNAGASDAVSRILAEKLGRGQVFDIDVRYDERFDPIASLPTPESCMADIAAILDDQQITFAPGSAQIEDQASDTLDEIAAVLRDCGELRVEIGGHTDSQGREEMNRALSQQRAEAVLEALLSRRVLIGGFVARGYGQSRPIADNATAAGREANRRIEFRLMPEGWDPDATVRARDPELEAMLEITVEMADEDTMRPREKPAQD